MQTVETEQLALFEEPPMTREQLLANVREVRRHLRPVGSLPQPDPVSDPSRPRPVRARSFAA